MGRGETAIKRIQSHMDRLGVVKSSWTVIDVAAEQGYSSPDDLAAGFSSVCYCGYKEHEQNCLEGIACCQKWEIILLFYREC